MIGARQLGLPHDMIVQRLFQFSFCRAGFQRKLAIDGINLEKVAMSS